MNKLRYQQNFSYSCGATVLLCAAKELGIEEIKTGYRLNLLKICEQDIYQEITGKKGSDPNSWGISMPSGIVKTARRLGLHASVVIQKSWTVAFQKIINRRELTSLRALNALTEVNTSHSQNKLKPYERELKILAFRPTMGLQMHYVMLRPDGSVMDPGYGKDLDNIAELKSTLGWHGTGISIIIGKP
ncbi:hypothetical protein HCO69_22300 [Pantoea sp. LS15]|uniref:hypothetical protein n=1 Tax=Enterobacterales TaxID=91347 RepID=UPI000E0E0982|nr:MULTISPECIES: hypothetical protein [Enterobacterales]NJQ22337.1 hypothetical protein [Pantoea sp. LS15]NKF48933.1 hypothetical protein [Pantoea sp. LS15]RDK12382.1 hypothetical protein CEJ32_22895 [Enterobacter sp. 9-2]